MPACPSPDRQFPFKSISAVLPAAGLDYHSDHTLIPTGLLTGENSLGVFLNGTFDVFYPLLQHWFPKDVPFSPRTTQGRLHCAQFLPHTGSSLSRNLLPFGNAPPT